MSQEAFDAGSLSARYALLDALPESVYEATLLNPVGKLSERATGLLGWRAALLAGAVPRIEEVGWPPAEFFGPLSDEIARLELPRFCRGEVELTDALLLSVLDAVAQGEAQVEPRTRELARTLQEEEAARRAELKKRRAGEEKEGKQAGDKAGSHSKPTTAAAGAGAGAAEEVVELDEETLKKLHVVAERLAREEQPKALSARIQSEWQERAELWQKLSEVFGELSQLIGGGWDLSRGVLRSRGWLELMRLHELLKDLPALRELIRVLGRMQHSAADTPSILEEIFVRVRRAGEERRKVQSPHVPMETRGIERSGEIVRMLPSEAALLGQPVLKLLWHARRAERGLLSYRVEGTDWERTALEKEAEDAAKRPRRPQQRGPILVCVDTSGSMAGLPEQVAKALALEAVRVAHAEKRRLYLYLFSGPGQVVENDLSISKEGVTRLLALLTMSFQGGTDVAAPLARAVERLGEADFTRADILLVSDGEFDVVAATQQKLAQARNEYGVRLHGVLIGTASGAAMRSLCERDTLHRFSDWADLARLPQGPR